MKESFHRRDRRWLMFCHIFSMHVAGRKDLSYACNHPSDNTYAKKDFARFSEPLFEHVECANCAHRERACDHRAGHIVRILNERPGIGQQSPKTCNFILAIWKNTIRDRMLHP